MATSVIIGYCIVSAMAVEENDDLTAPLKEGFWFSRYL